MRFGMNEIIYGQEHFADIWPDILDLTKLNGTASDLFDFPVEIDVETILQMESDGMYKVFTMRVDTELVGHCHFMIYNHTHHLSMKVANQDVIFVKNGHRRHATNFVQYCDSELRKLGVHVVLQHSTRVKEWGPVLERIGYEKLETTYSRRL